MISMPNSLRPRPPGDLAVPAVGAAVDVVRDHHRPALLQTPDRTDVRQSAVLLGLAFGKHLFVSKRHGNLGRGGQTSAADGLGLSFLPFLACLLSLFLGADGIGLFDLDRRTAADLFLECFDLLLKLIDSLVRGLKLPLRSRDEVDQPIQADPTLANILFELLDGVHAATLSTIPPCSCATFQKFRPPAQHTTADKTRAQRMRDYNQSTTSCRR